MAQKKHKKSKRKVKSNFPWFKLVFGLILLGIFSFALFVSIVWIGAFGRLPSREDLKSIENDNASEVYSADGKLMGRYFIENRLTIGNKDISPHVTNALISTEDSRFFEHKGIDFISLGRVLTKTIIFGNKSQGGGSTISQQLARNLFPRSGNSWWSLPVNKTKEAIVANRLEKVYSKEQILNLYLNTIPFGEEIFGIETASQRFFSKSAGELNPSEAAVLVGMLAANTAYNPRLNPERSEARRNIVLNRMEQQGFPSTIETQEWIEKPIELNYRKIDHNTGIAPYFRDIIKIKVEEVLLKTQLDSINIFTDGLKIYTTINSSLQAYAEESVKSNMTRLQKEFNYHWKNKTPWNDTSALFSNAIKNSKRYQQLLTEGLSEDEIMMKFNQALSTPPGKSDAEDIKLISPLDSIRQDLLMLHTGFLAIDPFSGHILAWIGGINHKFYQYDHVTSKRQVGSTFKPIVYSTALELGMDPCEFISNEKHVYEEFDDWSPSNSDGNYEGYYSLKGGLAHSVNTITAEIIIETGVDPVISLAKKMGITSKIPRVPSIALGSAEISLLEMLNAYTTFLRDGRPKKSIGLLKIEDKNGKIIYQHEPASEHIPVMDRETSLMMIHMLKEVVDTGTARSLRSVYGLQGDLAGKTGTTQNNADGWFIGFTPHILAGCWVGAENPSIHFRTTALGQGAYTALPVVARFFQKLERSRKNQVYTSGYFPLLPAHLNEKMDCPEYSRADPKMNIFEKLFSKKIRNDSIRAIKREKRLLERELRLQESGKKKPGFGDKIRNLFRKKKTEPTDTTSSK